MAHLLLIEVPGRNDFDVLEVALAEGHRVTFVTGDTEHYSRIGALQGCLSRVEQILEVRPFDYATLEQRAI